MTNKKDMQSQFNRMKALMNYGLNESKKQPYSGVEYSKVAADGKMYGIIREGAKFYIKVSDKKDALVENFEYIGGFRNRKDNEYTSFASAQKNFDFKLRSLAEAYGSGKNIVVESWNPEKNEELSVEATEKMKKEIARERQIMENTMKIFNRKPQSEVKPINEGCESAPFCEKPGKEFTENEKDNVKGKPGKGGDAKKAAGYKNASLKDTEIKEGKVNEEEVLGWNRNDNYMDKSHGTEIGDSAPFDDAKGKDIDDTEGTSTTSAMKQGTIDEGASMHDADNQNTPKPGVGNIGDNQPFDGEKGKQIDEAIDDLGGDPDFEDDADLGVDGEEGLDDEGFDDDLDLDAEDDLDLESDELAIEDSLEDRVASMEDTLSRIADKLGVGTYDDDGLYDDEDGDEFELEVDAEEDDFDTEDDDTEEGVFESKSYKAWKRKHLNESGMESFKDAGRVPSGNMNKLNDFGKHPAYQKKVMNLPPKDMQEFPGYYDMNDESVYSDAPYGEKIGDGAPFDIAPESVENAISESITRFFRNKKKV